MINDAAYWITIAHLPKWSHLKINSLIVKVFAEKKSNFEDFFSSDTSIWENEFELTGDQVETLSQAKKEIANNSFLAESLYNQGYELIPIINQEYSPLLKKNLKLKYAPPLLYVKGNKKLLQEKSLAIVGSRDASEIAINFTDAVAKKATENYQVVVSGFAKGVDKAALDSALKYRGQSIIVLPQGILTFGSGFRKYYKQIIDGDVLFLSTFHPKVPWRADLAMARNPIIYGLAEEIFVAESSNKGGTWSGVNDGLKKGRVIYVRRPDINENNANNKLIEAGAIPVDTLGEMIESKLAVALREKSIDHAQDFRDEITTLLAKGSYTAKEISSKLAKDWSPQKMAAYLKNIENIEVVRCGKSSKYRLKTQSNYKQATIWD